MSKTGLTVFLMLLFAVYVSASAEMGGKNVKMISDKILTSMEFGQIRLAIVKASGGYFLKIVDVASNNMIDQRALEFTDYLRDNARLVEMSPLEAFPFDLNGDKKDDYLIRHSYPIGAGPMAGMYDERFFAFINMNDRYVVFDKNDLAQEYIYEHEGLDSIEEIKSLYVSLYKGEKPKIIIGEDVADDKKQSLNLLENERLIISFKRQGSGKRVTLAIDKEESYLVYRYGLPGKVELTYKMKNQERRDKFHYFQDSRYGYSRYEIRKLTFTIGDYAYSIYDNYVEAHETEIDGVGVIVKNNKTGKVTRLKGDEESIYGKLDRLKNVDWIKVTLADRV